MKRVLAISLLSVFWAAFTASNSFAQQGAKIAVINSSRAFEQSSEGKTAAAQLSERDAKIKADLQKLDDAIQALERRLSTGQVTMTREALLGAQADLEKKRTERKRYEEDAAREFARFRAGLLERLQSEMVAIASALRKEKGYDMVLDMAASGIIDYDPALDITDELVRRYDASKAATPPVKK
ncbi:MAG TPA: OmpH family outer membrane protein [Terriglobales bacterium]|nr:OmpH family outer membrane protein [Terriglobales bacterium]